MYATPARVARPRSSHRLVFCIALFVVMGSPGLAGAQTAPDSVGKWSEVQPNEMAGVQVHMALVHDNGDPYHSRVVWWGAQAGHGACSAG